MSATGVLVLGSLTGDQARSVLLAAVAAPSLHNSQPWRFRCTPATIELRADFARELPATDPDHRGLLLACGAALLNLRLAIRALDVAADVRVLPDPAQPGLIAVVAPAGRLPATPAERVLAAAVPHRHTNRRPFSDEPVPAGVVHALREGARSEGACLTTVPPGDQRKMRGLLARAHRIQLADPAFRAEWAQWTGRPQGRRDGVPAAAAGAVPEPQDLWVMRDYSEPTANAPGRTAPDGPASSGHRALGKDFEAEPLIAVIGAFHDLPMARIQAGQAMQRVLLSATAEGISASFLSQVIEVAATRLELQELIGGGVWPQTVLRLGYGPPCLPTPRRDLDDVVDQLPSG